MNGEEKPRCDPEDIICQMQIIGYLKGLKTVLGEDKFKTDFPELQGLNEKIRKQETDLWKSLKRCSMTSPVEEIEEPQSVAEKVETPTEEE